MEMIPARKKRTMPTKMLMKLNRLMLMKLSWWRRNNKFISSIRCQSSKMMWLLSSLKMYWQWSMELALRIHWTSSTKRTKHWTNTQLMASWDMVTQRSLKISNKITLVTTSFQIFSRLKRRQTIEALLKKNLRDSENKHLRNYHTSKTSTISRT